MEDKDTGGADGGGKMSEAPNWTTIEALKDEQLPGRVALNAKVIELKKRIDELESKTPRTKSKSTKAPRKIILED